jgi:hypothetical protein
MQRPLCKFDSGRAGDAIFLVALYRLLSRGNELYMRQVHATPAAIIWSYVLASALMLALDGTAAADAKQTIAALAQSVLSLNSLSL